MSTPGFTAVSGIYISINSYQSVRASAAISALHVGFAPLRPQVLPNGGTLPNGNGGFPCHPINSSCTFSDPSCPSKFAKFVGSTCDPPGINKVCCTPPCPTTCGTCTGGSCGPYPGCGPVAGSGTQTCIDCHGNKTMRSC